jgi:rhamnulokinase
MAAPGAYAAIDVGASSARLFSGHMDDGRLVLSQVTRMANGPVCLPDGLHSDVLGIHRGMLEGLAELSRRVGGQPLWVGIDGWAVDYGLLDGDGRLLGLPYHYRDDRTRGLGQVVRATLGEGRLYNATGTQEMEFNTVYQLLAARGSVAYEEAAHLLMVPDLLAYFLTGQRRFELTNASTTQLVDARTGDLVGSLFADLGLRRDLFLLPSPPGQVTGPVLSQVAQSAGIGSPLEVVSVASHDTASAVLAVPAPTDHFAYVVSGTWSLVGLELESAVITNESREANFSNELGVDGTVRFLRNVMGHWMLQECHRFWASRGRATPMSELLAQAARCPPFRSLVATESPEFARPGDMATRARAWCAATGQPVPEGDAQLVRAIVDSMALAIADAVDDAQRCAQRQVQVVHVVGGGVSNDLLLSLVAAATGLDVVAGPVEASAVGNLLMQQRAAGQVGHRSEMRALVANSFPLKTVRPDVELGRLAQQARRRLADMGPIATPGPAMASVTEGAVADGPVPSGARD